MHASGDDWVLEQKKPLEGRYANCFHVGFNSLEVLIEFGQCHAGSSNLLHTRIILQPLFCMELMGTLAKCMQEYEEKYGAMKQDSK
jgi:hypothetical protein